MEIEEKTLKFGQLMLLGKTTSSLPLEKTTVGCEITGLIAHTQVSQHFRNPFEEPVELEYLFPLPHRAALVDFEITIANRKIKAELQEAEQAQKEYDEASQKGQQAALLKQSRPNLFSIHLANVMPGEPVQTAITFDERLTVRDGEVEFVFPMGLTPRYTSPEHPEEEAGANPPVALPGEPIGPVELNVHLDLGVMTGTPTSPSHAILAEKDGARAWVIQFAAPTLPDHDFVLRVPTLDNALQLAAWCQRDRSGEVILVNWLPPAGSSEGKVQPRDFVFVLDRSGSMRGDPIRQARNALKACLRILEPEDTFRILLFDDQLEWYQSQAARISQPEIERADAFLNGVEGRGGTEIIPALEAALSASGEREKTRYILFLTDGAVSAEDRALATLRRQVNQARIFTFGIGPSVNRALLSSLAKIGRGAVEFLQLDEDIEGAILRFQDKIAFPVLTQVQVEWTGCKVWDAYPEILPDLYSGEALELSARLQRTTTGAQVILSGTRGDEHLRIPLALPDAQDNLPEVTRTWARARVDALLETMISNRQPAHQVRQEIIQLAIEHHLLTPFTSFVAIDPQVVNAQGKMAPVQIAQPLPKGLDWSGFFPSPRPPLHLGFLGAAPSPVDMKRPVGAISEEDNNSFLSFSHTRQRSKNVASRDQAAYFSEPPSNMQSMETGTFNAENILRWLARSQQVDGSWNRDLEFTAVALLAFVRNGHTTRIGSYRKQVQKALRWLQQALPGRASKENIPGYTRVLALYELGQVDSVPGLETQVLKDLKLLPNPVLPFELAVADRLTHSSPLTTIPSCCDNLDELRLAAVLQTHTKVAFSVPDQEPVSLEQVWLATLS